jgi:hypothetical protein
MCDITAEHGLNGSQKAVRKKSEHKVGMLKYIEKLDRIPAIGN